MINAQWVVLWSDMLVWGLLLAVGLLGWVVARSAPLLASWKRVGASSTGMAAATLLLAFICVGVLDSLHYRPQLPGKDGEKAVYAVEVLSLLDAAVLPLRTRTEKTYSEPMATRLYAKEMVELPDGRRLREYPRLRFAGEYLPDEQGVGADVRVKLVAGVACALALWALLAGMLCLISGKLGGQGVKAAWGAIMAGQATVAWRAVLITLAGLLIVFVPLAFVAGSYHVFGTDKVGQDVFYQILKSIRTALIIGLVTTMVTLPLAVLLGIAAGYFRGWIDDVIQYVYTVLNSIPGVLLIAASVLMIQVVIDTHPQWFSTAAERADLRLLALCFIMGVTSWTSLCRLLRGETLKLRELEYIQAARSFGVADGRIITRHILPNLMHIVIIALVMDFSGLVLAEAVLSYIGIGVDPTMTSFGTMINNARLELGREPVVWWSLAAAFSFMFVLVLAANLFADAVRDAFDPRVS